MGLYSACLLASLACITNACSFLFANFPVSDLDVQRANRWMKRRGPDTTNVWRDSNGEYTYVHNLLHMTGEIVQQPLRSDDADMVALFNGEIYNWEELAQGDNSIISDGQVILPLYRELGVDRFARHLDGEFAILIHDRTRSEITLAADTFSTKPLWFAREGSRFAAATYKSALAALGFADADIQMVSPNSVLVFAEDDSGSVALSHTITVTEFDIRQYKVTAWPLADSHSIVLSPFLIRGSLHMGHRVWWQLDQTVH